MMRLRPAALCLAITLPFATSACGDDGTEATDAPPAQPQQAQQAGQQDGEEQQAAVAATLADQGPGACFDLVRENLGKQTKVNEIDSNFSTGKDIDPQLIDPEDTPAAGTLTHCSVKYQSPDDPKKLVQANLDIDTGTFSDPQPLEITVMGDAATFDLEDHLVALSQVDTDPVQGQMDQQQAKLDGVFSAHAWSGVSLTPPDAFSAVHLLRVDVAGRLASNDILDHGFLELSVDGATVVKDNLAN